MSASGRTNGALAPKRWRHPEQRPSAVLWLRLPDAEATAAPESAAMPTVDADRLAAVAKGAIVDLISTLPFTLQARAATAVLRVWPGFRST